MPSNKNLGKPHPYFSSIQMLGFISIIVPSTSALRTVPLSSFFLTLFCVMVSFPVFPFFRILLQNKKGQVDMHCTALKEEKKVGSTKILSVFNTNTQVLML